MSAQAIEALTAEIVQLRRRVHGDERKTVGDLWADYRDWISKQNEESTLKWKDNIWEHVKDEAHDVPVTEFAARHRRWVTEHCPPSAPPLAHALFSHMCKRAVSLGWLPHNPFSEVKSPTTNKSRNPATEEEYRAVSEVLRAIQSSRMTDMMWRMVLLIAITGQRPSTIRGLRRSEVDLERRLWVCRRQTDRVLKTAELTVYPPSLAWSLISPYLEAGNEKLFALNGGACYHVDKAWYRWRQKHELTKDLNLKRFRSGVVSHGIHKLGYSREVLKVLIGHSVKQEAIDHYISHQDKDMLEVAEKVQDMVLDMMGWYGRQ